LSGSTHFFLLAAQWQTPRRAPFFPLPYNLRSNTI
jgi:hypothetical protein